MIHPTAIIEKGAQLHPSVTVGPYAYVGSRAKIAEGTSIGHHATVDGNTTLGKNNIVHPYAYVGGRTQDLKYKGGDPELLIGDSNTFREFSTVHCGTTEEVPTRIGDHNLFLTYTHIAHECQIGSHNILSNSVQLAGHVELHDHVIIGGLSCVHQFVRLGSYCMLGGGSALGKDIPPFMMAAGYNAPLISINKVGLERNGFSQEEIEEAFRAYKIFYRGHTWENVPKYLEENLKNDGRVYQIISGFIKEAKRGIVGAAK